MASKTVWSVYIYISARLLVRAVHAGRSSRWTTASPFSQPQLARRPKVPAEHVWSSCLCRGCAVNLEFIVGWTAKPGSPQCHLPTQLEDIPVSTILGTLSALEALCDYALYKSTFTLHYIYITRFCGNPTGMETDVTRLLLDGKTCCWTPAGLWKKCGNKDAFYCNAALAVSVAKKVSVSNFFAILFPSQCKIRTSFDIHVLPVILIH